ncbi:beta/gamma crystallin-related protein [Pseudomarimonas arenosa]|uniref:Beta/gamma crystallin family protein n=1 Tax=Pseudomarimonas arenosa TaxID=2774145 RepID=A0AAW3ZKT1_9GAMM|nr:beta/gamma crystallin-related protein [Pseudomarimonas arenosa]MBD8526710.1 beta/gamma crystallin family protein [Pseudomarimonas arenosa]
MHSLPRLLFGVATLLFAAPGFSQITFYKHDDFRGDRFTAHEPIVDFDQIRFNDDVSSIVIERGTWEVCEHNYFKGRCEVLRADNYPSMRQFGLNDRISSARPLYQERDRGYRGLPPTQDDYAYRRRPNERLYEAEVTSVRAVFEHRGRHCWHDDRGSDYRRRDKANVGGAVAGAIIGGIIGHQIGDGRGQTAATVGGAAVGAAIGSRAGRDDQRYERYDDQRGYERGMVRCRDDHRGRPSYWDVSYEFRGIEHWVRLSYPPGRSITVNRHGEPRE